jgi:hypothetical protein
MLPGSTAKKHVFNGILKGHIEPSLSLYLEQNNRAGAKESLPRTTPFRNNLGACGWYFRRRPHRALARRLTL